MNHIKTFNLRNSFIVLIISLKGPENEKRYAKYDPTCVISGPIGLQANQGAVEI